MGAKDMFEVTAYVRIFELEFDHALVGIGNKSHALARTGDVVQKFRHVGTDLY